MIQCFRTSSKEKKHYYPAVGAQKTSKDLLVVSTTPNQGMYLHIQEQATSYFNFLL